VNDNLMELLIMLDAMRRSSAGRITAVIPYFGYARQDRRSRSHDPISAKLIADMITQAGANRILTMDLHCPQLQGFFNIPLDHMKGTKLFVPHIRRHKLLGKSLDNLVIVSPDFGSVARCKSFADELHVPLAIVDKRRLDDSKTEFGHFIGDVAGKYAVLFDDVLATGGSLCGAARMVKQHGAKGVFACVTHPILCGKAIENINDSPIEELIMLDTIEKSLENLAEKTDKIRILSTAEYIGDAIYRIHNSQSLGGLLNPNGDTNNSFERL
jgi:ribose-phosphate pyrophosphokinase